MTQKKVARSRRSALLAEGATDKKGALWERFGLAAVLVLAAVLNLYAITSLGYGNTYYAAAVKNMIQSPHNFFFVAYDAGFVSVDKPPLGLWIQGLFALIFGFHGWSILLPQALAGVASVAVLHRLVARSFGKLAALVAALALALTPIVVATSRNNTADMLLVLAVLLAAWAAIKAAETGRLPWLLVCAAVVGLGFNIKMMQAFLVVPAFYLFYLLVTRIPWWKRFVHLAAATVVLIAVSFSWATAVDLTPKSERPYVGSSTGDSVYNLIFGYNGLQRLLGDSNPLADLLDGSGDTAQAQGSGPASNGGGMVPNEYGEKGPLRLLNQNMAGQISWLLPLALVGAAAVAYGKGRQRYPLGRAYGGLVLWGTWALTTAAYFSVASEGHRYYLVMLAPPLAALVGAGTSALWRDYREGGWRAWALPAALVATAAAQAYMLSGYEGWNRYLTPVVAILCGLAAALLVVARLGRGRFGVRYATAAATVGVLSLFVAPTAWASYTVFGDAGQGGQPAAGPRVAGAMGGPGGGMGQGGPPPGAGQNPDAQGGARGQGAAQASPGGAAQGGPGGGPGGRDGADAELIRYLEEHQGDAEYLVAGTSSMSTDSIILNTDQPVVNMGGFQGRDPVFTVDEISTLVSEGKLKYFLIQGGDGAQAAPQGTGQGGQPAGQDAEQGAGTTAEATPPQGGTPPQGAPPQGAAQGPPPGGMQQGAPPQGAQPGGPPAQGGAPPPQGSSPAPGGEQQGGDGGTSGATAPAGDGQAGGAGMSAGGPGGQQTEITKWVRENCEVVPQDEYRSGSDESAQQGGPMGQQALYACDAGGASASDTALGAGSASSGTAGAGTPALAEAAASRRYEGAA